MTLCCCLHNVKIGDLKFTLEDEPSSSAHSPWLYSTSIQQDLPSTSIYLPPQKSEYLMQAYISNVDQSVRILHKPTILKQLNYFWRGVLPDFQDFEFQLAAIYCLALLSLSPEDCQSHLGEAREALTARFRGLVASGLGVLRLNSTSKVSSLQTSVLYIVSLRQNRLCQGVSDIYTIELPNIRRRDPIRQLPPRPRSPRRTTPWHPQRRQSVQLDALSNRHET